MLSELWSDLRYRARAIFSRRAVERELDDELRFHIDHEVAKYRSQGFSEPEAMRRATLAFGGVDRVKDDSRDNRGTILIETTVQDIRYSIRGLRSRPAFTFGVMITLGLGIGANASMFGIVDQLLFRAPAFMRDPATVHRVYLTLVGDDEHRVSHNFQFPRFLDLQRETHSFSAMSAFSTTPSAIGDGEETRERQVTAASGNYFEFFNARPALGRFFTPQDDSVPRGSPVVVLGHAYWLSEFGGSADVLGKQIRIGHTLHTIIGVAPKGFTGMSDQGVPAMYVPITTHAWDVRGYDYSRRYTWSWLEIIARRKPGVSIAAAESDLSEAHVRSRMIENPELGANGVALLRPRGALGPVQIGRGPQANNESKVVVWVGGVAIIVLLIACANVANLLLSRAVTRQREIALRLALGVSRGRLVRQLLTESLVLAVLGGLIGVATAQWGTAAVRAFFLPKELTMSVFTDSRTLVVALVATLVAAILTGIAPAVKAVRSDLTNALGAGAREAGARPSPARTALLVFQATLSVVLLIGAGLFVRSLHNVRTMRLGYDVDPLVVLSESMRGVKLSQSEAVALEQRVIDEVKAVPGVVSATPAATVPFWSNEQHALYVAGIDSAWKLGRFLLQAGNLEYFKTFGTRIIRGRSFENTDGATAPRVLIASQGLTKLLWPGQDPIGKCARIGSDRAPCSTVIGVAEDMQARTLGVTNEYSYYIPITQYAGPTGMQVVRVEGEADAYVETLRRHLQRVMPGASYVTVRPMRSMVDPTMKSWRVGATMFLGFGVLALVLAAVGLYSVIAYAVAQRRQEIGVRIALGASRRSIVGLVVGSGVRVVTLGIVAGVAIAFWASRWLGTLLFRQSPTDPAVYAAVAGVLITVALVATALPGFRAARVDPNVALRSD
jgi:putative ABC transport system permease protein